MYIKEITCIYTHKTFINTKCVNNANYLNVA